MTAAHAKLLYGVIWAACAIGGFVIPQLFDTDVGGALASEVYGIAGLVLGPLVAHLVVRLVTRLRGPLE